MKSNIDFLKFKGSKKLFKPKFQQFTFPSTFLGQSSKALHLFRSGFCCSFTKYEYFTVDLVLN